MLDQLYILPILLFSVIIHEISHGWMALKLGDPTARDLGRLTLNPIPHIDLIGSIIVPLFSLATAGQVFIAWAKPVPINPSFFAHYRRDDILVSVVGPLSNIFMALCCTVIVIIIAKLTALFQLSGDLDTTNVMSIALTFLLKMFYGGIPLNIMLAVFNMIPVPPLDGSHVLASLLPASVSALYRRIGFFGIFMILILMRWEPFARAFSLVLYTLTAPFFFSRPLFYIMPRRIVILADGKCNSLVSKTANKYIRYITKDVIGVKDSGQSCVDVRPG